jgi:hypothetical protein
MPAWHRYGLSIAQQPLPEGVQAALDAIQTAADVAQGVVDGLAVLEGFLASDPIGQAFGVIAEAYSSLLQDLEGTDLYALPLLPHSWADLLHPYTSQDAVDDVAAALSDQLDPNRPVFGEGGAFASLTILVGADNWMDFRRLVKLFSEMFSADQIGKWSRFADLRLQFDKFQRHPTPRADRNSQGATWDWYRANALDLFPQVKEALQAIEDAMDSLAGYPAGAAQFLRDLLEVLTERIAHVRQVLQEISNLLDFISRLAELIPNAAILWIHSDSGGSSEYLQQLENAANRPQHKLCAGVTIVAGTGNPFAYFERVKQLLGFQLVNAQSAAGQALQQEQA